jgi:hypothetical protein
MDDALMCAVPCVVLLPGCNANDNSFSSIKIPFPLWVTRSCPDSFAFGCVLIERSIISVPHETLTS